MTVGRLYVVATPIGNLEDSSARALRILSEVQLIAAEDTRRSRLLLRHYGIRTPLTSYHDHNEITKAPELLRELQSGKDLALITDSGTPCISDPGYRIVRAAHENGITVVAVPGPSAALAALSASGLPTEPYTYHGFFPRKRGQATAARSRIQFLGGTHVFFESPQRLGDTLALLAETMPDAEACVAREMTKIFEEIVRGALSELAARYARRPVKGECVLIVHAASPETLQSDLSPEHIQAVIEKAMRRGGLTRRDAIRQAAAELNVPRNVVYAAAMEGRAPSRPPVTERR